MMCAVKHTAATSDASPRALWLLPFAVTLVAMFSLQLSNLGFSPLLPSIQADVGMSFTQLGFFTGIYGLLAYSVEQRTQELGVRVALGAEPHQIRGIVLRQGGVLVAAGVAGGLVAAFYLSNLLASFLFGVEPRDAAVFIAVPVALTLLGVGTVAIVARRAGRVDPLESLRHD